MGLRMDEDEEYEGADYFEHDLPQSVPACQLFYRCKTNVLFAIVVHVVLLSQFVSYIHSDIDVHVLFTGDFNAL